MKSKCVTTNFFFWGGTLNLWPADCFSKCKTRDIPNKVCIVVVHNLISNCIFRIDLKYTI